MVLVRLPLRRLSYSVWTCPSSFRGYSWPSIVPISCKFQSKRHSSNGHWSPYYFISPDLLPIHALQTLLETVHSWTHLPWWAVIIGSTAVLRSVTTVPLAVHQNKLIAKIELHQPTVSMMTEALKHRVVGECRRSGLPADRADKLFKKRHRKMIYDYYQSEGCNPLKIYILPWIQLPLWFFLSLSLRNLTGFFPSQRNSDVMLPCPEIAHEGALWFPDLTVADPTLILPFAVGIINLFNIELNALRRQKPTRSQQIVTNTLRIVSVGMVFVASQVPTAMSLYWAVSAFFGLAQNIAFKFPTVRRHFGIPKTPSESEHPIQDLRNLARLKGEEFLRIQRQGQPEKKRK
ncbi:cytochrome c oxidase assembly protein COX18, mitochondrial-like [Montipora foliosa]|uniref:cytochrome c oxidase assembly protein COX18, mitochondrial-like n=1 Tax=Montipora foliosa TaxID=591990 RepID=UPI0035F17096